MPREIRSAVGGRELRYVQATSIAARAAANAAPVIEGYGAIFNSETVIAGMFREVIAPGAFTDSLKRDDVLIAYNHDANKILGRMSAKTATVEEDKKGLKYTATPPASRQDVVESIQRGDVTGSSFQFSVEKDDDESWDFEPTKNGMLPLRTIKRARVWETGPVAFPAYEDTTVSARAIEKLEEARTLLEQARTQAEAAAAAAPPAETHATPSPARTRRDLEKAKAELRCCMDSYAVNEVSWMDACRRACARCIAECAWCISVCAAMVNDPTAGAAAAACLAACRTCLDACTACLTACAAGDEAAAVTAAAACQAACEACAPLCSACAIVCAAMPHSEDAMACMSECQYCSGTCTSCIAACAARGAAAATEATRTAGTPEQREAAPAPGAAAAKPAAAAAPVATNPRQAEERAPESWPRAIEDLEGELNRLEAECQ